MPIAAPRLPSPRLSSLRAARHAACGIAVACSLLSTTSLAGSVTDGHWQPASCGAPPLAPALDLKDPDAYNRSLPGVNNYLQASRTYVECLTLEAQADIQAATRAAHAVQQAAREARDKILADVKAADTKFGK